MAKVTRKTQGARLGRKGGLSEVKGHCTLWAPFRRRLHLGASVENPDTDLAGRTRATVGAIAGGLRGGVRLQQESQSRPRTRHWLSPESSHLLTDPLNRVTPCSAGREESVCIRSPSS